MLAKVAKVDDGFDSEFRKIPKALIRGLGAPIELIIDLLEVGNVLLAGPCRRYAKADCNRERGGTPPETKGVVSHGLDPYGARLGRAAIRVEGSVPGSDAPTFFGAHTGRCFILKNGFIDEIGPFWPSSCMVGVVCPILYDGLHSFS